MNRKMNLENTADSIESFQNELIFQIIYEARIPRGLAVDFQLNP
jgi:hypothetical protein